MLYLFYVVDGLYETVDNRQSRTRYFAARDSFRVRRVALDDIPGLAGKNLEGGSWST